MKSLFALIVVVGIAASLLGCSGEESGTIKPQTQQMKSGSRGHRP